MANSDWFYIADCDDTINPNTLEFFNKKVNLLITDSPYNIAMGGGCNALKESAFVAICANCYNPDTGQVVGDPFPDGLVSDYIEEKLKFKIRGEHMGCNRTDLLKKYKFPEARGHFYAESRLWMALAVDGYKQVYFNENLRAYYTTENSLTNKKKITDKLDVDRMRMFLDLAYWKIAVAGPKIYSYSKIEYFKLYKNFMLIVFKYILSILLKFIK